MQFLRLSVDFPEIYRKIKHRVTLNLGQTKF